MDMINMWTQVRSVCFGLSYRCPMVFKHVECPVVELRAKDDVSLPIDKIIEVAELVKKNNNTTASFAFHVYNEPTIDPRLGYIIYHIRHIMNMPNPIGIATCTWGMDREITADLIKLGATSFTITLGREDTAAYQKWQDIRESFAGPVAIRINRERRDNRINIYKGEHLFPSEINGFWSDEAKEFKCTAPLAYLIIAPNGDVMLCEWDWARKAPFGNIFKDSWETIERRKNEAYDILYNQKKRDANDVCRLCTCQFRHW